MPSFTYTTGIPNPPNAPSSNVTDMQTNTNSINSIIQQDHLPFTNSNSGLHKQVNLLETNLLGTPTLPSLVGGIGFETLYSTTNSSEIGGSAGELYFTRGGSGVQIQLTGPLTPTPSAAPAVGAISNGYTFLPGGILMQWGETTAVGSSLAVSFPITFNNLLSLVLTGRSGNRFFAIFAKSNSGFTVVPNTGSSTASVYWIAIGN